MTLLSSILDDYFALNAAINDDDTRYNYRLALRNFADAIGHAPEMADFTDDNLARMSRLLLNRGLAPKTVNERVGRIAAFWSFLARRGRVPSWPQRKKVTEPIRTPICWLAPELNRLFATVRSLDGTIAGVSRAHWWRALLLVNWDTGERIGALLELRWDFISGDWLHIPAEVRKGKRKDAIHRLSAETLEALRRIRRPRQRRLFPWPYKDPDYIFQLYGKILEAAGLPSDRRSKFHRIRRSVASHFAAAGGDPTILLDHTSRETTRGYLDPRVVKKTQAIDLLFRPEADAG